MILVTGASGFVGSAVLRKLSTEDGVAVRGSVRKPLVPNEAVADVVCVGDLGAQTDWTGALRRVNGVVHTAARVHFMRETARDPLTEFRRVNVEGTAQLARQAAAAGVRRMVFISSVKVNGEATQPGHPFHADDAPAPSDSYGVSKLEAEQRLREISARTGLEVVILRPPLIYGPGVRANFRTMMRWVSKGIPLPLGAVRNVRSLVALENFVDLIALCLHHHAAAGQTFLVSDGEDLSTAELLRRLGNALGKPARLMPVPMALLELGAALAGRKDIAQRVCSSLQVDISKTRQLLGWEPPITVDDGLRKTAQGFLHETSG